jgi:protease-4
MSENNNSTETKDNSWEQNLISNLVQQGFKEQRASRRWGIFFKLSIMAYLVFVIISTAFLLGGEKQSGGKPHTAIVSLTGEISADTPANADNVITGLQHAFGDKWTRAVILRVNSPGGSPVQSGQINDEIYRLKALHPKIPFYAVVDDMCASGGYYIASAADKIYVDKASIIGSIGVRMDGFGFTGVMGKLGIERRSITAGSNKSLMDPFMPVKPDQAVFMTNLLKTVHEQFIAVVRKGRGARLKETPDMFSGLVWNGQQSVEMGLTDGLGSVETVARDIIKVEKLVDFSIQENAIDRALKKLGMGMATAIPGFSEKAAGITLH